MKLILTRGFKSIALAGVTAVLCGCHLPPMPNAITDLGPRYHPNNIYRRSLLLPPEVHRVAVLPVATGNGTVNTVAFMQSGVEALEPLLYAELGKTKRFEIIQVPADKLKQWTGKAVWRTSELLPPDFFDRVREGTGCDAILFSELTRCSPYQPVAVGWKFSLVATPTTAVQDGKGLRDQVLWSADEVLDAGDPSVANAARDYYGSHLHNEAASADASTILASPARFGQYTLAALLETMPTRAIVSR